MTKKKTKQRKEERKERNLLSIVATIVSVISVVIAVVSLAYQSADHEYKLEPVVNPKASFKIYGRESENGAELIKSINSVAIEVLEENNFDSAFIVDANYNVYALAYNDSQLTLEDSTLSEVAIETEDAYYTYCYLVMKSLDGTISIELIYVKSYGEEVQINGMNKDNIIEFDKGHIGDPFYEGERQLARKYKEISEYYKQYYEL